jgi:hypothetical protein
LRLVALVLAVGAAALLGLAVGAGSLARYAAADKPPLAPADGAIPADLLPVYRQAAATCPGLPWCVLAAVGWAESRHAGGHADPRTGRAAPPIIGPPLDGHDGLALISDPSSADGYAHALGPMQFLPATWAQWATPAPGRPADATPDPQNAWDTIYTAARMLCASDAGHDDIRQALFAYNHSTDYADAVLAQAALYADSATDTGPTTSGATYTGDGKAVVAFALTQLGVPTGGAARPPASTSTAPDS